jgi:hypothetical protein
MAVRRGAAWPPLVPVLPRLRLGGPGPGAAGCQAPSDGDSETAEGEPMGGTAAGPLAEARECHGPGPRARCDTPGPGGSTSQHHRLTRSLSGWRSPLGARRKKCSPKPKDSEALKPESESA